MSAISEYRGTPTEELIIDVLLGYRRLGELMWNFDIRNKAAIDRLVVAGLIGYKYGYVPRRFNVWLLDSVWEEYLSESEYVPPRDR